MGSLFEIETQLIITQELGFIKSKELELIFKAIEKEAKMINSLISKIKIANTVRAKSQKPKANS